MVFILFLEGIKMSWRKENVKKLINCLKSLNISDMNIFNMESFQIFHECGTTACALGWFQIMYPTEFCDDPEFDLNLKEINIPFNNMLYYFIDNPSYEEEELFDAIFGWNALKLYDLYGKNRSELTREDVIEQLEKILN